jgi:hypothetical protein
MTASFTGTGIGEVEASGKSSRISVGGLCGTRVLDREDLDSLATGIDGELSLVRDADAERERDREDLLSISEGIFLKDGRTIFEKPYNLVKY